MIDDRIVERLARLFADLDEETVLDAVLLFLVHLGLDDPMRLPPKLRARLLAVDPSRIAVSPDLLERIAEVFGAEKTRSLDAARAKIGGAFAAKKEAAIPIGQRTSLIDILKRRSG